ncbi:MAG TPA: hypothetical protein VI197_04565 [Polyangiaceae bacterium]
MSEIFTSTEALALKETLEDIDTDEHGSEGSKAVFTKWMTVKNMTDNYVDYVEYAGSGMAGEKPEGESYPVGTIYEGPQTRFNSRTYGQRMIVSEEAIEDLKYDKVVQAAKRNNRALWKLVDFDATLILVRATNTSFVGGDGKPLASATHALPGGGTYSNVMATPMSPSKAALVIARAQLMQMVGHDGLIDGVEPKKVVFPVQQWGIWEELLSSKFDPTPGAFNAVNVVNKEMSLTPVPVKYWTNTTTNWGLITDADLGIMWLWRRKPKSNTWVTEDKTMMNYAISARWSRGWVNPRAFFFSEA